ncbi:MAG: hypothetical protein J6M53_01445 [Bacteroidaceae bacterium]|nr:hypothetical protein [Bacteroidaceae bacterium]
MEIILNPKYKHLHHFLEHLDANFPTGELVQQSFNEIRILRTDGLELSVKRYGHSLKRRLKFYKIAKGKRAFIGQRLLRERGYESPDPVAFVRYRKRLVTSRTYFVTIRSTLAYSLDKLDNFSPTEQEAVVDAFAAFTRRLHEDGFIHHNYKAKHVLFDRDGESGWRFALIDVNRVHRKRRPIKVERGLRGFERLLLPGNLLERLTREYARLRGFDEEEALRIVRAAHDAYQQKVARRGR